MNFFNIALNNIRKKFSSYLVYFISTIFAVTIFNIFCSIYYNPQFAQYRFGTSKITVLFQGSAVAILLFSSVFVLYSNQFFVKTRKKEIAIYSLLGMKKSQIGRMLFYENIIMGILATACGVVLGVIFSRFFTMILLNLMAVGTKISFSIEWEAIVTTVVGFLILFVISSLNAYGIIYRYQLIELLSASKEGEKMPNYSVAGGLISAVMIVIGYVIAMTMNVNAGGFKLFLPALIVISFVVTGTLLFFQNFVPMAMIKVKQNKRLYYKPANFISISQIVYRIQANSKMLSIIAVLSAVTMVMVSMTYSMYNGLVTTTDAYSPFSYMCKNTTDAQNSQMIQTIQRINEVKLISSNQFKLIKAQGQNSQYSLETKKNPGMTFSGYILSQSAYQAIITNTHARAGAFSNLATNFNVDLKEKDCYFLDGNQGKEYSENLVGQKMNLKYAGSGGSYNIVGAGLHKYIGVLDLYQKPTIVLNDKTFDGYLKKANEKDIIFVTGFMFDKPMDSQKTVDALNKIAPVDKVARPLGVANLSHIGVYKSIFSLYGAYIFIGMFVGILFLLASGSIMYYKQIIEAQEEVNRYDILKKTGMNRKEVGESISKQLAIAFGIPLLVGLSHSVFALLTYNRAMDMLGQETPTLFNALIIVAIYIVIYCFFYALSVKSYMRIVWGKEK